MNTFPFCMTNYVSYDLVTVKVYRYKDHGFSIWQIKLHAYSTLFGHLVKMNVLHIAGNSSVIKQYFSYWFYSTLLSCPAKCFVKSKYFRSVDLMMPLIPVMTVQCTNFFAMKWVRFGVQFSSTPVYITYLRALNFQTADLPPTSSSRPPEGSLVRVLFGF